MVGSYRLKKGSGGSLLMSRATLYCARPVSAPEGKGRCRGTCGTSGGEEKRVRFAIGRSPPITSMKFDNDFARLKRHCFFWPSDFYANSVAMSSS